MVSTVDWDQPTGTYADLVRVMVENQGKVEWGASTGLRNSGSSSRDDVPVEDHERELLEFDSIQEFRGPWTRATARR